VILLFVLLQMGGGSTGQFGDENYEMGNYLPFVAFGSGRTVHQIDSDANHNCVILGLIVLKQL